MKTMSNVNIKFTPFYFTFPFSTVVLGIHFMYIGSKITAITPRVLSSLVKLMLSDRVDVE